MQLSSQHEKGFAIDDQLGCASTFFKVWQRRV